MKPFLFVGNLKMNPVTRAEVDQYLAILKREAGDQNRTHVRAVLCPPFIHLPLFVDLPVGFSVGGQNGNPEKNGPFTGEVSLAMLKDWGATHVILGHSEQRDNFGENMSMVKIRTEAALRFLLEPIVCIGETAEERERGVTEQILREEVRTLLSGLSKMQAEKIIIAYEPRWSIGTGITPSTLEIKQVVHLIREILSELTGEETASRMRIIYGGSVKSSILSEVSWEADMQGVLVGGESLFAYEVVKMMNQVEEYFNQNNA